MKERNDVPFSGAFNRLAFGQTPRAGATCPTPSPTASAVYVLGTCSSRATGTNNTLKLNLSVRELLSFLFMVLVFGRLM